MRCRHPAVVVETSPAGERCTRCHAHRPPEGRWRSPGLPPERRDVCVVIRLSEAEADALDALLAKTGQSRGAFVADLVAERTRPASS